MATELETPASGTTNTAPGAAAPAGGAGSAEPAAGAGGVSASSSSSAGAGAAAQGGGLGAAAALSAAAEGAGHAPSPAAQAMESIRDVMARMGATDLTAQFGDDQALLQHLVMQHRQSAQSQELARYGQQVIGQWPQVQKFLAEQQQLAAQQQQAVADPWYKEFWNPPEWNPGWEKLVLRDAQGNLHPAPGAPPDIVQRYTNYQQFRAAQVDKLMNNPYEYFGGAITKLARQEAQRLSQETLARHNDTQFAQDFIRQNADWLWAHDPNTKQPIFNPSTREPVLSQWGTTFRDYVTQAQQQGITDVRAQQAWALKATQLDYYLSQQAAGAGGVPPAGAGGAAAGAGSPRQVANQQFLNQANQQSQPGSTYQPNTGPAANGGQTPANQQGLSLAERLRGKFAAAGVKGSDLV